MPIRPLFLIITILIACNHQVAAQSSERIRVEGLVVDQKGEPIPFAHIRVKESRYGTIGNAEGAFKLVLPQSVKEPQLLISAVGYKSLTSTAFAGKTKYKMEEDVITLQSVVVVPVDYARQLIIKARQRIPENYPDKKELLTGFYRERSYWDDNWQSPIYVLEMVNEVAKESYQKEAKDGHIRLVQGRNYESPQIDTLSTRFYAGPHIPHRADVVARRFGFLSGAKKYDYELIDTTRYMGRNLFQVRFRRDEHHTGEVFIQDSTYAIVRARIKNTKFFDPLDRDRVFTEFKTEYEPYEDQKWRLAKVVYSSAFDRKKGLLNIHDEYITTSFMTTDEAIPYIEQLQFRDIALDNTGAYDANYWDQYTIALPDSATEALFSQDKGAEVKSPADQSLTKRSKPFAIRLINLLGKLEGSYALQFTSFDIGSQMVSYIGKAVSLDAQLAPQVVDSWSVTSEFSYKVSERFLVGYRVTGGISEHYVSDYSLRIQYKFNLNPMGRPIYLSPIFSSGVWSSRYLLANIDLSSGEEVDGRLFDATNTAVFSETRFLHTTPELRVQVEKSNTISFFGGVLYPIALNTKKGLTFIEHSGFFLTRKTTFVENGRSGVSINGEAASQVFSFNLGLLLHF
jgi:hypothetical protein